MVCGGLRWFAVFRRTVYESRRGTVIRDVTETSIQKINRIVSHKLNSSFYH